MPNSLQKMRIEPGLSCIYNALFNVLQFLDLNVTESDIYFLCDPMSYKYKNDGDISEFVFKPNRDIFLELCLSSGLCGEVIDNIKTLKGFQSIIHCLNRNIPVVCMIDQNALTYFERNFESDAYQNETHCIILQSIDTENGFARIADGYYIDRMAHIQVYIGNISLDTLLDNCIVGFAITDIQGWNITEEKVVWSMRQCLSAFLHGHNHDGNSGISALRQAIGSIDRSSGNSINNLAYLLKINFIQMFDYLSHAIKKYDTYFTDGNLITELLIQLKRNWNRFYYRLLKLQYKDIHYYQPAIQEGLGILEQQESLFVRILEQVKSMKDNSMEIVVGNNCFFACMHNLLVNQSIFVTESELFFCGKGLDLCHSHYDLGSSNFAFVPYSEIIKTLGDVYGFRANILELPDVDTLREHLERNSTKDQFLLAFIKHDLSNKKQADTHLQLHSVLLKKNKLNITMIDPYHISAKGIPEVYVEQCHPEDIFKKCEQLISICADSLPRKPDVRESARKQLTVFFTGESGGISLLLIQIRKLTKSPNYEDVESLLYTVRIRFMCVFPYVEDFIKERLLYNEKQMDMFLSQWKTLRDIWEEMIIILIRLSCKMTPRTIEKLNLVCSKLDVGHKNLVQELLKLTFL